MDDLPGWWKLGALAGYVAVFALVTQVPRLWGVQWLWEHALLVLPVVAVGWFAGVLWAAERWAPPRKRVAATAREAHAYVAPEPHEALVRARSTARRISLRRALAVLAVPLAGCAYVLFATSADDDQRLLDTQPPQTAVVVGVHVEPLDRTRTPDVTVDLGGRRAELGLSFAGDGDVRVGDAIQVVVDPDDPSYVLSTRSHDDWVYEGWVAVLVGAVAAGVVLVVGVLVWRAGPPRRAVRAARRATTTSTATVDRYSRAGTVLRAGDTRWVFRGATWAGRPGLEVVVVGELGEGRWVVVDSGRTRWPLAPLAAAAPGVPLERDVGAP
ncbi:hypothetical protein [Cellulomonas sp. PhB150]|uniref:hypothetical protein n=1 Tax=Cellulomonas sp. PhB150 TaxID=2485188 RepID=UPI000F495C0E|nr:hypothetical protein [Cellulomonas sp. PhB150]ROS23163.1 hypothetical protein EDF34_3340 [Cellulomonas sp. PhB150]